MADVLDVDVLRRFAAGDEDAFRQVHRRYAGAMFTVALHCLGRRDLAADAVQQAFLQAWRAAGTYRPDQDLAPWLFTITRRSAIDLWRRERRHEGVEQDGSAMEDVVPGPSMEAAWEAWQVRQALDGLPADERDVLHLTYVEDLTHTEAAERLHIPIGTLKSRSSRAHRRLAAMLGHLSSRVPDAGG